MFLSNLPPRPPRPPRPPLRADRPGRPVLRSPLAWTVFILLALALALLAASRLWTEVLWFSQLGYLNVFTTQWITRVTLFVTGAVVMGLIVWLSMWIAYRARPIYVPDSDSDQVISRYRAQFEPVRRPALIVVPALIGLFAGGNAANQWENVLQFLNSAEFGQKDPQWNLDLSFYVFQLPTIRFIVSFSMGAV
ncbi:MAG: UPF0182 family protein, partial [Bifidobacteriaceae bacterium]|nr:UPF0182 family protein [Bifidobacteriaceae bacterium]